MNIRENIDKQLNDNVSLVRKIEKLMIKVDIMSDNERDILLAGFTRNTMSHFLAINILIEKKLYNSAFALVRIYFESIIKLKYMYYIMDDAKISTIYTANSWDRHFPTIHKMAKAIDKESDVEFYLHIKENAYKIMNDYTHTGVNQIARNFNESDAFIESNFSDELILDTLKDNKTLLKTSMVVFIESIGFKNQFITKEEMDAYLTW